MMNINGYDVVGRMPTFKPDLRDLVRQGIETETRRVMKTQPQGPVVARGLWQSEDTGEWLWQYQTPVEIATGFEWNEVRLLDGNGRCPYGKPGDIRVMPEPLTAKTGCISYDPNIRTTAYYDDGFSVMDGDRRFVVWQWKRDTLSSLFMPTEYGRTIVQYTDIRAERLQDITDEAAIAEGVELHGITRYEGEARDAYINMVIETFGWKLDDWVWVIKWRLL